MIAQFFAHTIFENGLTYHNYFAAQELEDFCGCCLDMHHFCMLTATRA